MAGRVRVLGGFAAFGAFWGAWGATLPAIQAHAGVDDGQLGIALLCIGAGRAGRRCAGRGRSSTAGAPRRCPRCSRPSPRRRCSRGWRPRRRPCAPPCSSWARPPARSTSPSTPRAPAPRRPAGRPVLSLAHGTFSACVVAGSLAAGALRAAGAGAQLVLVLVGRRRGRRRPRCSCALRPPPARGRRREHRCATLPRLLVILGGLCALAFFVENAWQSWGAVHLETDLGASPGPRCARSGPLRRRRRALAPGRPRPRRARERARPSCAAARRWAPRGRCSAPWRRAPRSRWPASSWPARGSPSAPPSSSRSPGAAPTRRYAERRCRS